MSCAPSIKLNRTAVGLTGPSMKNQIRFVCYWMAGSSPAMTAMGAGDFFKRSCAGMTVWNLRPAF